MDTVLFEIEAGIGRIILNRPDAANGLDLPTARALAEAAARCAGDDAVRCVVLTGAGRMFCAGGDIAAFAAAGEGAGPFLHELASTVHQAVKSLAAMAKPLLVLVNGPAAGAGLSLAALGDIVIAARTAHFTSAYTAIGLTPDGGLSWLLPRLIGLRQAQEMILTNRRIDSDMAAELGLITRVVDDDMLEAEGAAVVARLAAGPTAALGAVRGLLRHAATSTLDDLLDREADAISRAAVGAEGKEGVAAFLARRKPVFGKLTGPL